MFVSYLFTRPYLLKSQPNLFNYFELEFGAETFSNLLSCLAKLTTDKKKTLQKSTLYLAEQTDNI